MTRAIFCDCGRTFLGDQAAETYMYHLEGHGSQLAEFVVVPMDPKDLTTLVDGMASC